MTARYPSSGGMMPAFIITGSRIIAATSAAVLGQARADGADVVERHDDDQVHDRGGDAGVAAAPASAVRAGRPRRPRQHRDLHRVVVAVIAALDLDDQVASGERARQMHGVHGGFGAGVGEPPQRQVEAAGQLTRRSRSRPRSAAAKCVPRRDPVAAPASTIAG